MKLRNILALSSLPLLTACSNIPATTPCYVSVSECLKNPGYRSYFEAQARSQRAQLPTRIHRVNGTTVILNKGWRSTTVLD